MQLAGEYTYALVMDAAVPGPSKVLALLSSLGIALHTHAIAIWNSLLSYIIQSSSLPSYIIQSSASSPKFLKYHISNLPSLYLFLLLFKVYMC